MFDSVALLRHSRNFIRLVMLVSAMTSPLATAATSRALCVYGKSSQPEKPFAAVAKLQLELTGLPISEPMTESLARQVARRLLWNDEPDVVEVEDYREESCSNASQ